MGMDQRQVQVQKLAPRMIQSMEILQLPLAALEERIEQEMTENPALEMRDRDPELPEERTERENPDETPNTEKELVVDVKSDQADDFERLLDLDRDAPGFFDEAPRRSANRIAEEMERRHDELANLAERPESLHDFLTAQLGELDIDPQLKSLCERIISTLKPSDGGYFRGSLRELLPPNSAPEDQIRARQALEIVQALEPPGIAARDLRECLLLQLAPGVPYYEEVKTLITGHLEDLSANRIPQIQRITGYDHDTIQDAWRQLRKLNPKPAARFVETHAPAITPDIQIRRDESGKFVVSLQDGRTPSLFISRYYRQRLQSGQATAEEREYIKRKINAAQWLIESIEQRRSTLTRVAQEIVDHQRRFLDDGPEYIEPLKMQDIADRVGVHVTTVSRAVGDKWIETPRGIFPLKRFFVGGTTSADGESVAWDRIRIKLQEVIDAEDKAAPLSDDDLVRELGRHGLKVARRTITKYRKKMGIASSRQRRDWSAKCK